MTRRRRFRAGPWFGSHLLGSPDESPRRRRTRVQVLLTASILTANVLGIVGVGALLELLVPDRGPITLRNALIATAYFVVAVVGGMVWGHRTGLRSLRWLFDDLEPTERELRRTLRLPLRLLWVQAVFWVVGALVFAALSADVRGGAWLKVGLTILLGGIVTCNIAYLLSEFAMRPLAARALAAHAPDRLYVPGVRARSLLAWATGSGIPIVGLLIGAVFALTDESITSERLAVTVLALGGTAILIGLLQTLLASRATVDPIRSVRAALARVEDGDLGVVVPVYDGTEVGLLQAGFNQMVTGLRERERIRDLFERHVGEEVAREALERERGLEGELCHVAVLFVDVVGSTQMATHLPPTAVVERLNRFFAVAVDVVTEHGGLVNKLIGDAVLAVWGAPTKVEDPAGRALAAARALGTRLPILVPELSAGIGVAAGEVVAGNVGTERRFEFTVIGDPVNEAARLTDLAKGREGRVVASLAAFEWASAAERSHWRADGTVELRGRAAPTAIALPLR